MHINKSKTSNFKNVSFCHWKDELASLIWHFKVQAYGWSGNNLNTLIPVILLVLSCYNSLTTSRISFLQPLSPAMLHPLWIFTLSLLRDDLSSTSDLFQSFHPCFNNWFMTCPWKGQAYFYGLLKIFLFWVDTEVVLNKC